MRDEVADQLLNLRAIYVVFRSATTTCLRARGGLFICDEFGGGKYRAVHEIIDPQRDGFRPSYRAQVPGEFQVVCVRLLYGHAQFLTSDVHVGFEGRHAFRRPIIDHAFGIVGAGEFVHLGKAGGRAFEVGRRRVNGWAGHEVRVYAAFDFQVGVGLEAPGGAHGGYASCQIEARRGVRNFRNEQTRLADLSAGNLHRYRVRIVEMIVHSNQAGNDGVAGELEPLRTLRDLGGRGWADGLELSVCDHDCLIFLRRRAGSIDYPDVAEDEDRCVDAHEGRGVAGGLSLGNCGGSDKQ